MAAISPNIHNNTTEKEIMVIKKNVNLTVEELEFPFWVLHYAQNRPQNQTYPSTSKKVGERDKLKNPSYKYATNAILNGI
jgi:glutamate formiminotransferase